MFFILPTVLIRFFFTSVRITDLRTYCGRINTIDFSDTLYGHRSIVGIVPSIYIHICDFTILPIVENNNYVKYIFIKKTCFDHPRSTRPCGTRLLILCLKF